MYGRTPAQAVRAYVALVQRIVDRVAEGHVWASGYQFAAGPHSLVLNQGDLVPFRGGPPRLAFRLQERYTLVESAEGRASDRWRVALASYAYGLDEADTERHLLAFHWHTPGQGDATPDPHLHIGAGAGVAPFLMNAHVPTGQVLLPDVLRFAIAELGVTPRRDDWATVFAQARTALAGVVAS